MEILIQDDTIMSVEDARAFIEKIRSDGAFKACILAIEGSKGRLAAAKDAGFCFTEEEINAVSSELSLEELDTAAGGLWRLMQSNNDLLF